MLESRRHFRINENFRIRWGIEGQSIRGEGRAIDISTAGMQIIIDQVFDPLPGHVLMIDPVPGEKFQFPPRRAKIAWFKKISHEGVQGIQCGLEFV